MFKYFFVLPSLCGFMLSCSPKAIIKEAKEVIIVKTKPNACKYLGDITSTQGNFITGFFTSYYSLETGARNELKNKAHKLEGNTIHLITSRGRIYNVTLGAEVYQCDNTNF